MKIRQKDVNFYSAYRKTNSVAVKNRETLTLISILAVFLIVISSFVIFFRTKTLNLEKNIENINFEINQIFNDEKFNEMGEIQSKTDEIKENFSDMNKAKEYISAYPELSAELLEEINSFRNISVQSYNYNSENAILLIECHSVSASEISEYIKNLRECGECSDVEFSGYTSVDDGFKFSAVCTFEKEGEETEYEY